MRLAGLKLCFVLAVLASPFRTKRRLEAETSVDNIRAPMLGEIVH
jgi:hypothetical protein